MKTVSHQLINKATSSILVLVVLTLAGCGIEEKAIPAIAEELRLGPKILSASIPGIPDENIEIDHKKNQIIVTVPADLINLTKKIEFTIQDKAEWASSQPDVINFCSGTLSHSWGGVSTTDLEYDNHTAVIRKGNIERTYRVVIKQNEDMYFASKDKVIEIEANFGGSFLSNIPIYNFSDGDNRTADIVFTNTQSGNQFVESGPSCWYNFATIDLCRIPANAPLGEYSVQLRKKNGRKTTNQLRVLLKAGAPYVAYLNEIILTPRPKDIKLVGANLYPQAKIEVEIWHHRTKESHRMKPVLNDPSGREGSLPLPVNLKAGQYYYKVYSEGKLQEKEKRLIVRETEEQPVIFWSSSGVPIILKRNMPVNYITCYPVLPNSSPSIKLTSITDGTKTYLLNILTRDSIYELGPNYFNMPSDIPSGRYLITMQYKDVDGVLQESEPLETDVIVE
ncbi:hypothetical protein [Larkinella humicola]|uniref:Uncharacterized protein n=1 Tax=Larkinella humicola TaxID=2607654 RepID=A0A5N1JQU9_9BACT|nr:hypothetical protein [Larkinella humicola]KAA9356989.1 hypothetical protein F0P93_04435 [Larkinella humicola]